MQKIAIRIVNSLVILKCEKVCKNIFDFLIRKEEGRKKNEKNYYWWCSHLLPLINGYGVKIPNPDHRTPATNQKRRADINCQSKLLDAIFCYINHATTCIHYGITTEWNCSLLARMPKHQSIKRRLIQGF